MHANRFRFIIIINAKKKKTWIQKTKGIFVEIHEKLWDFIGKKRDKGVETCTTN